MIMDILQIIQSQYLAALEMLKQVIVKCPEALWNASGDVDPSWRLAYHTLFYTHLYLQDTEEHFRAWEKHHDPKAGLPFTREEVLEYLAFVQNQVQERIPLLNPEAGSGFNWLRFSKLELQLYNIRHIQQHSGELFERLGSRANIELDWVDQTPAYLKNP
jgi:DinB superfamily